jgi:hypothetical protein
MMSNLGLPSTEASGFLEDFPHPPRLLCPLNIAFIPAAPTPLSSHVVKLVMILQTQDLIVDFGPSAENKMRQTDFE